MVRLIRKNFWHFPSYDLAKEPCTSKIDKSKLDHPKLRSDETPTDNLPILEALPDVEKESEPILPEKETELITDEITIENPQR